jgi:hypothetical protein
MYGLVNQSWRDAFIKRQFSPESDVAGREFARLFAQQNPRGDARLAPKGIVTWLALRRHDESITHPRRAVKPLFIRILAGCRAHLTC